MADAFFTNSVTLRDGRGRFLDRYQEKKRRAAEALGQEGARVAFALASKKSGRMASSITSTSGTSGFSWTVRAPYWKYQEEGTRPHDITGWVRFWWMKEGRPWTPGTNTIRHPGNRAVHFMRDSFERIQPQVIEVLKTA